ncbi:MAG: NDP-sugar synthase [Chloroflexi bacterium]|nr:NDP-sugar synthase [Chloroflexota bacterium]
MAPPAVVLAIGNPNHFSQLAYNRPRAMLPVLGKPLVLRAMESLHRAGVQHYIVIVGEDEGSVAAYLNTQWLPNVRVEFVLQPGSSSLTRTLARLAQELNTRFILASYNAFAHSNFPDRLLRHTGSELVLGGALLSLSKSRTNYYGVAKDHAISRITQEIPADDNAFLLANMAVCGETFIRYLSSLTLNTSVFTNQFLDIARIYLQAGGAVSLAETTWTLPIETDYDLLTLNRQLLTDQQDSHILSELPGSVQIIPPVRIDPHVSVGQGARIGPRVYLESGCSIGQYAVISDAIIFQNAIIPAETTVHDAIISNRLQINGADIR